MGLQPEAPGLGRGVRTHELWADLGSHLAARQGAGFPLRLAFALTVFSPMVLSKLYSCLEAL